MSNVSEQRGRNPLNSCPTEDKSNSRNDEELEPARGGDASANDPDGDGIGATKIDGVAQKGQGYEVICDAYMQISELFEGIGRHDQLQTLEKMNLYNEIEQFIEEEKKHYSTIKNSSEQAQATAREFQAIFSELFSE